MVGGLTGSHDASCALQLASAVDVRTATTTKIVDKIEVRIPVFAAMFAAQLKSFDKSCVGLILASQEREDSCERGSECCPCWRVCVRVLRKSAR